MDRHERRKQREEISIDAAVADFRAWLVKRAAAMSRGEVEFTVKHEMGRITDFTICQPVPVSEASA